MIEGRREREGKENYTIGSQIVLHALKLILNGVGKVNSSLLPFVTKEETIF